LLFLNSMAHFAKLIQKTDPTGFTNDTLWVVEQVVVVDNNISTSNGPLGENDMHIDGETWCNKFFKAESGETWKQTSYSGSFRNRFAGIGFTYNEAKDAFIAPQPYSSWTLDNDNIWVAPIAQPAAMAKNIPEEGFAAPNWDEDNQRWYCNDETASPTEHHWNPETSSWDQQ